jgi:hypothetical protein
MVLEADTWFLLILLVYIYSPSASPSCSIFPRLISFHGGLPYHTSQLLFFGDIIDLATQGAAFTREERAIFGLEGMIPYEIHDLTKQSVHKAKAREMGFGGLTCTRLRFPPISQTIIASTSLYLPVLTNHPQIQLSYFTLLISAIALTPLCFASHASQGRSSLPPAPKTTHRHPQARLSRFHA